MSGPIIPVAKEEAVSFVADHIDGWTTNATPLGLSGPQISALTNALTQAQDDLNSMTNARLTSKAATGTFTVSVATMRALTQQIIDRIRLQAESTNNPDIYNIAHIPAPQPAGPTPPPEAATEVSADPNADGTVTIRWKGTTSNGQFFTLWRRIGDGGTWSQIGSVAGRSRSFVDDNVPSPVTTQGASLFYMILAQRGTETSDQSNYGVIQYGDGPGFAAQPLRQAA